MLIWIKEEKEKEKKEGKQKKKIENPKKKKNEAQKKFLSFFNFVQFSWFYYEMVFCVNVREKKFFF